MKQRNTNPAKKRSWDYERTVKYLNEEKGMKLRENLGLIVIVILLFLAVLAYAFGI